MKMPSVSIATVFFIVTFLNVFGFAQVKTLRPKTQSVKPSFLHIGDKIPGIYFRVHNYKENKIRLSDNISKLILLDMWGTYCGSCIDAMPEIEKLQGQFKDSIQVLMVTKNSDLEVKKCALRSENVRNNHLPFINGKDQLAGLFNLSFVPQYVWIDSNGIIKYVSEEADVSAENIRRFLAGKELDIKVKIIIPAPNGRDPLLIQMYPYLGNNFYIYSYLAVLDLKKYTTGSSERNGLNMEKYKLISGNSFNFKSLYKMAYGFSDSDQPINDDRVIINFKDTANYSDSTKDYIYEMIANKSIPKTRILKHTQSELDVFFNVNSQIEKRDVTCLVFKRLNNGNAYHSAKKDTNRYDKVENMLKVTLPWGKFLTWTNGLRFLPPHTIIDETGIDPHEITDFQMSINFNNMEEIRKSLASFGLTIYEEERQEDCIVISEVR